MARLPERTPRPAKVLWRMYQKIASVQSPVKTGQSIEGPGGAPVATPLGIFSLAHVLIDPLECSKVLREMIKWVNEQMEALSLTYPPLPMGET